MDFGKALEAVKSGKKNSVSDGMERECLLYTRKVTLTASLVTCRQPKHGG